MPIEREDFENYINLLRDDIQRVETGINSRLDMLNGKTNQNTVDIAIHRTQLDNIKAESQKSARNHGALWGTLGSIGVALIQALIGMPTITK